MYKVLGACIKYKSWHKRKCIVYMVGVYLK